MKIINKRINTDPTKTSTGIKFTMSTSSVDRVGDRVMPSWNLDQFKLNPIALAFHDHTKIVGFWKDIGVVGTELVGTLELAKKGTSALVDEIRSLVDQGILKAVSIGFSSGKVKENDFGGFDLYDNLLLECSLVAVPANYEAVKKSLSQYIPDRELEELCSVNGCSSSKSDQDKGSVKADTKTKSITTKTQGFKMTYAERIAALQKSVAAKQTQLDALNEKHDLSDEDLDTMATLTTYIASESDRIKKFETMEKAAGNIVPAKKTPSVPTFEKDAEKTGVLKGVIALSKAVADNIGVDAAVEKMYKGDKVADVFAKAATAANPAMTTVPEWAGDLVREGYGSYLADLVADTIFGRVGGLRITFGQDASISIPYRDGNGTLAGDWIAEGEPIPVKQDKFATAKLAPQKMGVITTFTKELMRKSTPAIEGLVKSHMISDTQDVLDTTFLDATAATAVRPAGLEAGAGAANIVASTGATVGDIEKDLQGVFERFSAKQLGGSGVIIMNPARKRGLSFKQNALGQYPFRGENMLDGFNIITSTNVPADKVYFVDDKALAFGLEQGVEFDVSTQATLVMSAPAEAINDGTTATSEPVRSLFQTDTIAIKQTLALTWKQLRASGVQILTGVSW
jgi:hypothetical protein